MKKPIYKRKWFIALIVIIVLIAIGSALGGNDSETPAANNDTTAASSDSSSDTAQASTAPKESKEPEVSQEFKNALKSAQTYSDMMHMSKDGLYEQLTSEYGDHFPADAAQYAVDNVNADWNYNALKSAETNSHLNRLSML